MSNGTFVLPAAERVVLAFEELLGRLEKIEPNPAAVFPEALEAASKWTVAEEESEELATILSALFFEALAALAREMREE